MLSFTPTASMVLRRRETGYGPTDQLANMLWTGTGALFLGEVALSNDVEDSVKGCQVRGLPAGSV
jgi:hypothetical protein